MKTILSLFTLLLLAILSAHADESAQTISLKGAWRFALDRKGVGIAEKWFDRNLDGRVQLPGALQNQGLGDDITVNTRWIGGSGAAQWMKPKYEKYRQPGNIKIPFFLQPEKHYVGAAWYQRDIDIPAAWQNRRVVVTLERAHWETQAWLDDQPLGTQASLSAPHVYDLGAKLTPGRHRLSIRVDNRMVVNVGWRAHSVSDETQGNWNGLIGDLTLSTTSPVWIEDAQVYPDIATKTALVKVRVGNATGKPGAGELKIGSVSQSINWSEKGGAAEVKIALGADARLWDEFSPNLQHIEVKLTGANADDQRKLVFGLREIAVKDGQFVINGRPTFFRGTLECCIFPLTGYPPTDVESWKRIIRICQFHGLNHMRFHSWCPPEAAFVAADELGFYCSAEVAAWTEVGSGKPIDRWLYEEAARIQQAYGNHPSFLMMPYGNEPNGANSNRWLGDWVNYWKQTDFRRLYTSAAGWPTIPENQYHIDYSHVRGISGWLGLDYKQGLAQAKWKKSAPNQKDVPVIVHEMGQWCVYPDFDEIPKYTGPLKPKNFEIFRDSLTEHGMLPQARDFFMASGKLQVLCYKEEIEAALRTPGICGVQLLDLHDFPGQGTSLIGVLDPFWNSKPYITPAQYRRFYNSTVPLARLLRRTWTANETLTAAVEIAHFGAAPLANARPYWKVFSTTGKVVASGEFPVQTVPIGQGTKLGDVRLALEKWPAPQQYKLVVGLNQTPFENDWNFWVYPTESPETPKGLLVTESFDDAARKQLAEGGKVLLASGKIGSGNQLTFQPIFWNRFMWQKEESTLGLLCEPKHPALALFPTEYFQDWQWQDIVTKGHGIVLDELPRELKPIVQPIDDWNTNSKLGLVFECKVGPGKLLVCAADLSANLGARPAARQLRASLLNYVASNKFKPSCELSEALLMRVFENVPNHEHGMKATPEAKKQPASPK